MSAHADTAKQAERTAREARDHPALEWPARVGFLAYGVVYTIVAVLAAQLALGEPAGSASGRGALEEVAERPLGSVALWLAFAGLAALTLWEVCQAVGGHRAEDGVRRWAARAASAGRAVVFGVLAVLAVRTVLGDAERGGGGTPGLTERLLALPLGEAVVIAVGVGVLCVGLLGVHRGLSDRWRKGLDVEGRTGTTGRVVKVLARVGYVSRGAAFLVIGGLFVWAGATHDPDKSGGLDQAITRLRDEPYAPWLIVVVAVGLGCYGAFHIARAVHLRGS